jgi:hypothetical protein
VLSASSLAEAIRETIRPDQWAAEYGTQISARDEHLVVVQRPEIHGLVEDFLRQQREDRVLQVRVEARLLAVSEAFLAKLQVVGERAQEAICLSQPQLEMVRQARDSGEEAAFIDAAQVTCFNGQRTHVRSGKTQKVKGGEAERWILFGTVLDVRPVVSFDRKYVTMELRIARGTETRSAPPAEEVYVSKIQTTVACMDTGTVLVGGVGLPGADPPKRLVALVTPTIQWLEPRPAKEPAEPNTE